MCSHSFTVEQRPIPNSHEHDWVAIDDVDGAEIDLPRGGTGPFLGRYPEIAAYLAQKGVQARLDYSRARGDSFDPDYERDVHSWMFATAGGIVVKDIPRLVFEIIIQR